jgi:integrase/recombinase XerD
MSSASEIRSSSASRDDSLESLFSSYLQYLEFQRGLAANSLDAYRRDCLRFAAFVRSRLDRRTGFEKGSKSAEPDIVGKALLQHITEGDLEEFVRRLRSEGLSARSAARTLACVRGLFAFLVREGVLAENPAKEVKVPETARPLPRALSLEEIGSLLASVPTATPVDLRDLAILEFMYATGARIAEVAAVDLSDIDLDVRSALLRGKGGKERVVPFGGPAARALGRYIEKGRPVFAARARSGRAPAALFLNQRGRRLTRQGLWSILKKRARQAGLEQRFTPHVLRHSCATHMLEGGADIRTVQEMLGHASLRTTQIYTKVTFSHIQSVYRTSHPRAGDGLGGR